MIRPAVTSYSLGTSEVSTVLPDPVAPTIASVSPGEIARSTSCSTCSSGASGKAKPTPSNRSSPRGRSSTREPETIAGIESKISRIRADAVIAS